MENKDVKQLILSLRNEFAAMNYTDDPLNNTPTLFFDTIRQSGKSLHGEEKVLYDVLKDTFVLDYYNANFWSREMTNINSEDLSQIETWSALDFKNYTSESFRENDLHTTVMKNIHLSDYREFFPSYHQDLTYYKTLLEWYLMRKINFLSNTAFFTENDLKKNETEINTIYEQLISENEGNTKLHFMYEKMLYQCSLHKELDRWEQLQTLFETDVDGDYKVLILRDMMSIQSNLGNREKMLAIADQAKQQFPDSAFLEEVQYKVDLVTNPVLRLNFEKQAQSHKPIHLVAEHQNISDFVLNIYEVQGGFKALIEDTEDYYSKGNFYDQVEKRLVRKEYYQLPENNADENMKTSLEIQPMSPGLYVAEFSLTDKDSRFHYYFSVSDYKIIFHHKDKNDYPEIFTLVDSEKGRPIPHEEITFFEYTGSDHEMIKLHTQTDEDGHFEIPSGSHDRYYKKYIIRQPRTNDFQMMRLYGSRFPEQDDDPIYETKAQIFTDRAIYRPGQTVYFKVINSKIEHEKESVVSGIQQKIVLTDANDQEVSAQEFITNEFGSYHGSFILPKDKLNGLFTLSTEGEAKSNRYFRVEEYKRPKFEVTFEPVHGEYKYGQSIELKGKAMMYSGVALSHVTVEYEIKQNDIRWKFFNIPLRQNGFEDSITGKAETDDKGGFTVPVTFEEGPFTKGIQVDQFEIEASVTDINGETQSASVQINVASVSYYIKAEEIKDTFTDENVILNIETKNYNNQSIEKPYYVKLSKLKSADRIFRSSFNDQIQNLSLFSEEEFTSKFPYDHFDESEYGENRKTEKIVLDTLYTPSKGNDLDLGKLEPGSYKLELSDSQHEKLIETSQYFKVWDRKSMKDEKTFLRVINPKKEFLRGEKATIYVYSSIPDALVYIFVQDGLGNTVSEVRTFQNGILKYSTDIPEDQNISALTIQFQIIAYNDIQHCTVELKIKQDESPLSIETTTFRDIIQPGSQEKWSVKISGKDSEPAMAEVLATMYDMSLDHFAVNTLTWQKLRVPYYNVQSYDLKESIDAKLARKILPYVGETSIDLPYFNWYDGELPSHVSRLAGYASSNVGMVLNELESPGRRHKKIGAGGRHDKEMGISSGENNDEGSDTIPVRQNLNETAFFYPDLKTDAEGNVNFEFTSPEALTKWKLMFLAHTKDAHAALLEKELITQKEFSVTPNYPRFLREGDVLNFQSKISNLTDKKLNGFAELQILNALTNENISVQFGLQSSIQNFEVKESGNSALTWTIKVPENIPAIIVKVIAKAGQYSDGEQKEITVLPNKILVTDALPIFLKEGETKTFEMESLKNNTSTTVSSVSNTLELTTHPVWEIIFALPSLKNDPNSSADVIFNKWFADVLASEIFRTNPKIKAIFEDYQDKGLLNSNLEKNQELKHLLLDETPWVLESKDEAEQMQKLALLFDVNSMKNTIHQDWNDFIDLQNPDGGFSWYQGYPSSYSTSLYILKSLGKINTWLKDHVADYQHSEQKELVESLIQYVDKEISNYSDIKDENVWDNWVIAYLDTRNYWEKEYPLKEKGAALKSLVIQKVKDKKIKDFTFFGLHRMALLMNDYGLQEVSGTLMGYLKETSIDSKTQGTYWKQNLDDWGWFSSKTVNHAGALEAFNALQPGDQKFIENLKIWLITQKEVNSWGSSRSTAEVIFTLLHTGKSWTETAADQVTVTWGGKELKPENQSAGYIKSTVKTTVLDKSLATMTVTNPASGIVQGGLFWQYYEDMETIQSSENYISVNKELYKKVKTSSGHELQKISAEAPLKTGDKVTVRMILNTDRSMEFIHIKDMRAAGFEPVDTLSGYRWKNNLGYYQSTKDASTHFYIEYLPKGKYVFEYDYIVNASGKFSNGITTIQNYYAPQMNAQTKGSTVEIY
jgi:uncharacterized protein YfaS (alpha-2-macroglobulin family)